MWNLKSKNLSLWSLAAALAALPFQAQVLLYQAAPNNPYTQIHFLVFEIFLLFSALFFIRQKPKHKKVSPFFSALLGALVLSLFLSPQSDDLWNLLLLTKLAEALLFYALLINQTPNKITKIFLAVMSGEALLGLFQFFTGSSLGLTPLGEPHLSVHTLGLAKIDWGNLSLLRAYGTFPHPNVLGGFLAISILLTLTQTFKNKQTQAAFLLIQILGLFATFSRSALLALFVAVAFLFFKKRVRTYLFLAIPVLLFVFFSRATLPWQDPALTLRFHSFADAWALIKTHPWGLGWNHYTVFLDEVATRTLELWEYQPLHNMYGLFISETGILGAALIIFSFFSTKIPRSRFACALLLIPLITGIFDHYWLSLPQGNFLAVFLLALVYEGSFVSEKSG